MTKRCDEYGDLQDAAQRCEQARIRFPGGTADESRAREILTGMAVHCRLAATVFDIDPTLATEPSDTDRFRAIDLLLEMARMVQPLLRVACYYPDGVASHLAPKQERWDEIEALFARAGEIAQSIVDVVPRRDYFTIVGAGRIMRERLAARAHHLSEAAGEIRHACDVQEGLPTGDAPLVEYLMSMVAQLERYAEVLTAERKKTVAMLAGAAHLPV